MANSKETSFNNTISSTLSFITVLSEDLFEAINIQVVLVGEKEEPKPSITSLNKTNTCDGYDFNIDIINNDEYNAVQKEPLMMFEGFCIFGFWEFFKNFFCILMEVNKTMYGNNKDVPKRFLKNCIQNHTYVMSHLQLCGMSLWQMKQECQSTINELNLVFFSNVALFAWNNMLEFMQYQVRSC